MGPGGGVGEQDLRIAGPDVARVRLVGRPGVAGDAADDFERVGFVEALRCYTPGIVDRENDFREVPRGTAGGAGEDHVLHAPAAHRRGPGFAHHPAQRLEEVRLAAAVRADDPRQPIGDHEIGGIDEALEAIEPEPCEAQGARSELIPYPSHSSLV